MASAVSRPHTRRLRSFLGIVGRARVFYVQEKHWKEMLMKTLGSTFGLAAAALIGVAGCSRDEPVMDAALSRDLEAVRASVSPQLVISPVEAGVSAAPKAPKRTPQPVRRPSKQVATISAPTRRVTPAQAPVSTPAPAPAPTQREVVDEAPSIARPGSAPVNSPEPPGGYRSVQEVLRERPWIRP